MATLTDAPAGLVNEPTAPRLRLKADDIPKVIESPEFAALPFPERVRISENALKDGAEGLAGTWDRQTYQAWGEFAAKVREKVAGSETAVEKAKWAAGVVGGALKDAGATVGTLAAGLSPLVKTDKGWEGQFPGETLAPMFATNAASLVAPQVEKRFRSPKPLQAALESVRRGIDSGEFFDHPQGMAGWLDAANAHVASAAAPYYRDNETSAGVAQQNGLITNAENAALLGDYLRTRNPEIWTALVKRLEQTPLTASIAEDKAKLMNESKLGRMMAPEARQYIVEAADPIELTTGMFAVKKGVQAVQRGMKALGGAKETAKAVAKEAALGAAGEMTGEQLSAMMDDPNLTWQQRGEIAKQSLIASLGLMGAGAGVNAAMQRAGMTTNNTTTNDNAVSNPQTNAPGAAAASGGNPFSGPIVAPEQPAENAGGMVTGPRPVAPFVDDPFSTAVRSGSGNVIRDFGIQRTPEAQAKVDAANAEYQASQARALGQQNRSLAKMPVIPDNPLGYRDLLDFVNENPLHIPRAGTDAAKAGEYDWVKGYDMPKYYRRFLASSEGGHNADVLAQMAFDEGYIQQPTPDALIEQMDKTIRERTQYKVEFRRQQQAVKQAETQVRNFEKDQQKPRSSGQRVALQAVEPGDAFTIGNEDVVIRQVEHDEDGNVLSVTIEDGKRYGVMSLDAQSRGAILVDEFKPRQREEAGGTPPPNVEETPFMRNPSPGVRRAAEQAAAAARGLSRGPGAAARPSAAPPAASPVAAVSEATSGALPDLASAYAAAAVGSSTQMQLISQVYEKARAVSPSLTPEVFLRAVKDAYDAGQVYLESYDAPEVLNQAGGFVVKDAAGVPAVRMMVVQPEEVLGMRGAGPAVAGPLPSTYQGAAPGMPAAGAAWSGQTRTLHGIRDYLLNAVGLPAVGVGRFGQKALGVYKTKPESIRLQAINDIPVLAHEIGHHVHYRFLSNTRGTADTWNGRYDAELVPLGRPTSTKSYTGDQIRKEGVAEFTRLWLTDPAAARAAAPVFSSFWEQTLETKAPEAAAALKEARAMIADYVAMPAFEKAKAQIVFDPASERKRPPVREFMREVYARFVNTLQPALDVVRQAAEMNPTLEAKAAEVEMWMENHRGGWAGKAGQDIFGRQTDLHGAVVGPGLQTILKDLKPGEQANFSAYLALKRAQELEARGLRSGFEQARLPASEMAVLEGRFEGMRQKLMKWQRNERDLLVQAGLLDEVSARKMDAANADYVPFYRMYEKLNGVSFGPENSKNAGGYVDLDSGIRRLKGSDRAIIDPLQSAMKNAFMFRKLAEQNLIGVKFFDLLREVQGHARWGENIRPKMGMTKVDQKHVVEKLIEAGIIRDETDLPANADLTLRLFQAMTRPDTKNGEVIIFKKGKREHWEVKDPLLMAALKSADADAVKLGAIPSWLLKIMTLPTKVLRFGATGGPWFALPNLFRDNVQGGVMSRAGYVPFLDAIRGGMEVFRKGAAFERWKQAGGEFSGLVTGTEAFTRLMEDALPKDPLARRALQGLGSPKAWLGGLRNALELVGEFGKFTEQATRVGEFMRAKQGGASDMEAANFSKTVSLNFARAGEVSRVVNQFIPFFNATVQGLDQIYQAHADPKTRGATVMKGLMYITLPSVLCWALGKDDEEIQNLPDYRKNLFWNVNLKPLAAALGMPEAGFILSVPKPFLMGAIYGTSVERLLDYATGRDPNGAQKMVANILDNTMDPFEIVTQAAGLRGLYEAKTNHNLFTDREIVPQSLQHLPKEMQYNVQTSQTARLLGEATGQSPMIIDHLLRSYFASAAKFGTDAIDYGMAKVGLADVPPAPRKGWMELPILNRFAGSPYAANAWVGRFYEASKDMEGKLSVFNKQTEQMTSTEQQRWWKKNREELAFYLQTVDARTGRTAAGDVRKAQATLSEIGGAMKNIHASRVLSPEAKRQRLIELARQRNEVAEQSYKALFPEEVRMRHH